MPDQNEKTDHRYLWLSLVVAFTGLAIYQTINQVHLYSDGSYFFLSLISQEETFAPLDSRIIADFLTQVIPLGLMKLGATNVKLLSFSFGFNQFIVPILGMIASYLVLPKEKKPWIIFVIASYLLNLHHNNLYIISESFVSVALFWPIFLALLFNSKGKVLLFLGLVAISTTHEASLILFPLLFIATVVNIRRNWSSDRMGSVLLGVAFICAAWIQLYWFSNPQDFGSGEETNGVLSGVLEWKVLKYIRFTLPIALLLILQTFVHLPKKLRMASNIILGVLLALITEQIFKGDKLYFPILNWEYEGLTILTSSIMAAFLLVGFSLKKKLLNGDIPRYAVLATVLIFTGYQIRITSLWSAFHNDLLVEAEGTPGLIAYENSPIASNEVRNQFAFKWTIPSLALVLSLQKSPEVESMVTVPFEVWQPWKPQDRFSWPDLTVIDVEYRLFGPKHQDY